jgi:hypothetical protein
MQIYARTATCNRIIKADSNCLLLLPKHCFLLEDLEPARNHLLKHAFRVVLPASSLELGDILSTPATMYILRDIGVVLVDKVNKVTTLLQDRLLLLYDIGNSSLNKCIIRRLGVRGGYQIHHVVGLARHEAEHVGAIGDGLRLRQEFKEHALHV